MRTYPGLVLLGGVIGGIFLADALHPSIAFLLITALVMTTLALVILWWRTVRVAAIFFLLALTALSALHYAHRVYELPPSHVSHWVTPMQRLQIFGEVADWPELKPDRTELIIALDSLGGMVGHRAEGRILVRITDTTTALQRGDRVELYGRIYPIEARSANARLDFNRYLNRKGIFGAVYLPSVLDIRVHRRPELGYYSLVDRLRAGIRDVLYRDLSPTHAALAAGFLIGETRDIPVEIYQRFRDSGTLHLMAVSGSNVAIVVMFFMVLLAPVPLSRMARASALFAVVLIFTGLSYGEPSVIRAAVMASLVLIAGLLRRRYDLNNIIAFAMLIILLVDPPELFDVGFQLSFATAWGLIFCVPRLTDLFRRFHNTWWYRWLVFPVLISLVAQVCSAPLIACYFGTVPLISVIANLVIVPLASIALVGILVMLLAHLLLPVAGLLVGRCLDLLLAVLLGAVNVFGESHLPALHVSAAWKSTTWGLLVAGSMALIVIFTLALRLKAARRWLLALLLVGANVAVVGALVSLPIQEPRTLYLTTLPGGMAVLSRLDSTAPDLIITGLANKPYDIDEKIIIPWLKRHDTDSLRYIILLSGQYRALDDVIRLVDTLAVSRIYVSSLLEGQFRQAWRECSPATRTPDRVRFFGRSDPQGLPGYHLDRTSVTLSCDHAVVVACQSLDQVTSAPDGSDNRVKIALLGRAWYAGPEQWIEAHRIGYDQIVCSRIAQPMVQSETDPHRTAIPEVPDYLYDLSQTGDLEIELTFPPGIGPR